MIDHTRWERAKEIVDEASEMSASDAHSFVTQACGDDPVLLAEVQSLLAHATRNVPSPPIAAGTVLGKRYRVQTPLGMGGFSVTWLAEDLDLHGRRVVIKIPLDAGSDQAWLKDKFRSEIEALAALKHPGIVSPLDVGTLDNGTPFLVMEHVDGKTLREILDTEALSRERVADIVRQIGRALRAVGDAKIYHRDLKPENVMVQSLPDGSDHVRLIDFGIATIRASQTAHVQTRVVGSLRYMAPEQLMGEATATTDVYAFGVIACELISATTPVAARRHRDADTSRDLIAGVTLPPNVPARSVQLIRQALRPDPHDRPSQVDAFAEELARTLTLPPRAPRTRSIVTLAVVTTLVVIASAYWFLGRPSSDVSNRAVQGDELSPRSLVAPTRTISIAILREGADAVIPVGGEIVLNRADGFRIRATPDSTGHLYVFAESPYSGVLNILFPSSNANGGSSIIDGGRPQLIPDVSWLTYDGAGTDRLWVAWSRRPVDLLERARKWATPDLGGRVADARERQDILALLVGARRDVGVGAGLQLDANEDLSVGAIDVRHP